MSSHRQIFKSTALIGGTQVLVILIGIARTKALALLLGPAGMGLAGLYMSATSIVSTVAGFGIGAAGVRQIAEAAGSGDDNRIARVIQTLRRVSLLSGLLGMAVVLIFCRQFGRMTFSDDQHTWAFALLSITLLCGGISGGQNALLQGLRRLKDLAAQNVLGTIFGSLASVALVYWLREKGVVWFIVAGSFFAVLSSWWFARRVRVKTVHVSLRESMLEARGLLGMGMAFVVSGFFTTGVAYLTRILIVRRLGMEAVGLYTATWTLSAMYVGVILSAMGADFYPRLTAAAGDDATVNRLVNEQTEIGLLLATPGILATLALAPWVLRLFYSSAFLPATVVIQWQVLGVALRVVSWPMGFIQLAKGKAKVFIITETIGAGISICAIVACMHWFGLTGVGIAFPVLYTLYTLLMIAVSYQLSGFVWSGRTLRVVGATCGIVAATAVCVLTLPMFWGSLAGVTVTMGVSVACLLALQRLLGITLLEAVRTKIFKQPGKQG